MQAQPPPPMPWGAAPSEAIELCRQWMIFLGAVDTVATVGDARGVCDLYDDHFLAWVDNQNQNLEMDLVDRAARVCAADGRRALIFVPGGVFPDAQDTADDLGVALFRFDAFSGDLDGANRVGRQLRTDGLALA